MNIARLLVAGSCLLPAACATPGGGSLGIVALDPNQHVSGAEPLLGMRGKECDATSLLAAFAPESAVQSDPKRVDPCLNFRNAMAWTLRAHPGAAGSAGYSYTKEARNEVIGMLMADSDIKCDRYTQFIQQYNSNVRSGLGILGHAATSLAAIATGGTAQALSTGASITSNASGQIAKGHFQDQTIPIIVAAYQTARTAIRQEVDKGMKANVPDYALAQGVRDAVRYHSNCSVVAGIRKTAEAVQEQAARDTTPSDGNPGTGNAAGGNAGGGNADGNGTGGANGAATGGTGGGTNAGGADGGGD